jgi:hypothetical protein
MPSGDVEVDTIETYTIFRFKLVSAGETIGGDQNSEGGDEVRDTKQSSVYWAMVGTVVPLNYLKKK